MSVFKEKFHARTFFRSDLPYLRKNIRITEKMFITLAPGLWDNVLIFPTNTLQHLRVNMCTFLKYASWILRIGQILKIYVNQILQIDLGKLSESYIILWILIFHLYTIRANLCESNFANRANLPIYANRIVQIDMGSYEYTQILQIQ